MLSMVASTALPAETGILGALGPLGAVADMAMMAFGSSFSSQMSAYDAARKAMTPAQIHAESIMMQGARTEAANLARRALGARILQTPRVQRITPAPAPAPTPIASTPRFSVPTARPLVSNLLDTAPASQGGPVSFLSGIGKVFSGVSTGLSDVRGIISAIHPAATAAGKAATVALDAGTSAAKAVGRTVAAHPVIAAAGAASAAAAGIAASQMGGGTPKAAARAHLKNIAKGLGLHHRRMHVTNTKALHRALRRVKGFERVARRVLRITMTKPHKVHFKFRKHRRAA